MKADTNKKTADVRTKRPRQMAGISIIEVIIVLVIIAVLSAISLPYIYNSKRLYKSEDQALKVMDLMREASQLALNRRRTIRLEIDLTDDRILIIDEDNRVTPTVHREIKSVPLEAKGDVRMNQIPTGVTKPNPPDYNDAAFAPDVIGHLRGTTSVIGNNVYAIRFKSDGSAVNAADNVTSANLYFWTPLSNGSNAPRSAKEVRAVTIFGGSGAIRYWKHNGSAFEAYN